MGLQLEQSEEIKIANCNIHNNYYGGMGKAVNCFFSFTAEYSVKQLLNCKGTTKTAGWTKNSFVKSMSSTSISTPTGLFQPCMDQDME